MQQGHQPAVPFIAPGAIDVAKDHVKSDPPREAKQHNCSQQSHPGAKDKKETVGDRLCVSTINYPVKIKRNNLTQECISFFTIVVTVHAVPPLRDSLLESICKRATIVCTVLLLNSAPTVGRLTAGGVMKTALL